MSGLAKRSSVGFKQFVMNAPQAQSPIKTIISTAMLKGRSSSRSNQKFQEPISPASTTLDQNREFKRSKIIPKRRDGPGTLSPSKSRKQMDQDDQFQVTATFKGSNEKSKHKLDKTLPKIDVRSQRSTPRDQTDMSSRRQSSSIRNTDPSHPKKETDQQDSFHFSNDEELWRDNFTLIRPKNFMKRNVHRVVYNLQGTLLGSTDDGSTSHYADTGLQFRQVFQNPLANKHLYPVKVAKKKLEAERLKIKNIIANNPYLVKNYITLEGGDINNSLMPKKLLHEKLKKIENDDEFVEDYLKRIQNDPQLKLDKKMKGNVAQNKFKQRLASMAKIKQIELKSKLEVKASSQVAEIAIQNASNKVSPKSSTNTSQQEEEEAIQKSQALLGALQATMGHLVVLNKQETKAKNDIQTIEEAEKVKDKLGEGLIGRINEQMKRARIAQEMTDVQKQIDEENGKLMSLLQKKQKRSMAKKHSIHFGAATTDQQTSPKSQQDSTQDENEEQDLIFGDFKKIYKEYKNMQDRQRRFGARHHSIDGIQSQALAINDRNQIELDNINTKILNRKDTSIQQLLGPQDRLINLKDESQYRPNVISNPNSGFLMTNLDIDHATQSRQAIDNINSTIQQSNQSLLQSKAKLGGINLDNSLNHFRRRHHSFVPSQIKSYLSNQRNSALNQSPSNQSQLTSFQNQSSNFVPGSNASLPPLVQQSPSVSTIPAAFGGIRNLEQTASMKALQQNEVPHSSYLPLDTLLKAKFRTDFVPGRATEVQACKSKAVEAIKEIVNQSKRFKENSALKDIAQNLNARLKTDRSSINYNRDENLFAKMPHYEREFKNRKYEAEDLYLKRQELLNEQVNQAAQLLGQPGHSALQNVMDPVDGGVAARNVLHGSTMAGQQSYKRLLEESPLSGYQAGRSSSQLPYFGSNMKSVQNLDQMSDGEQQVQKNEPEPPNIIHVTLEANSLKQLIKLSKDLIPANSITTEIERQGVVGAQPDQRFGPFLKLPSGSPQSFQTEMTKQTFKLGPSSTLRSNNEVNVGMDILEQNLKNELDKNLLANSASRTQIHLIEEKIEPTVEKSQQPTQRQSADGSRASKLQSRITIQDEDKDQQQDSILREDVTPKHEGSVLRDGVTPQPVGSVLREGNSAQPDGEPSVQQSEQPMPASDVNVVKEDHTTRQVTNNTDHTQGDINLKNIHETQPLQPDVPENEQKEKDEQEIIIHQEVKTPDDPSQEVDYKSLSMRSQVNGERLQIGDNKPTEQAQKTGHFQKFDSVQGTHTHEKASILSNVIDRSVHDQDFKNASDQKFVSTNPQIFSNMPADTFQYIPDQQKLNTHQVNEQVSEFATDTQQDKVGQADEFGLDEQFLRERIQLMAQKNQILIDEIQQNNQEELDQHLTNSIPKKKTKIGGKSLRRKLGLHPIEPEQFQTADDHRENYLKLLQENGKRHFEQVFKRQAKYYQNQSTSQHILGYISEQKRQNEMHKKAKEGFKLKYVLLEREKIDQKKRSISLRKNASQQEQSEFLLNAANYYILNSNRNILQNKVRELLVETELGKIAKGAQIVIHMQEDAKQLLRDAINEEYRKKEFEAEALYQNGKPRISQYDHLQSLGLHTADNHQVSFSSERYDASKAIESHQQTRMINVYQHSSNPNLTMDQSKGGVKLSSTTLNNSNHSTNNKKILITPNVVKNYVKQQNDQTNSLVIQDNAYGSRIGVIQQPISIRHQPQRNKNDPKIIQRGRFGIQIQTNSQFRNYPNQGSQLMMQKQKNSISRSQLQDEDSKSYTNQTQMLELSPSKDTLRVNKVFQKSPPELSQNLHPFRNQITLPENITNFSKQVASIQLSETNEKQAIHADISKDDLMTPKPFDRSNIMLDNSPLMLSRNTPEKFQQKSSLSNQHKSSLKKSRPNQDLTQIYDQKVFKKKNQYNMKSQLSGTVSGNEHVRSENLDLRLNKNQVQSYGNPSPQANDRI